MVAGKEWGEQWVWIKMRSSTMVMQVTCIVQLHPTAIILHLAPPFPPSPLTRSVCTANGLLV